MSSCFVATRAPPAMSALWIAKSPFDGTRTATLSVALGRDALRAARALPATATVMARTSAIGERRVGFIDAPSSLRGYDEDLAAAGACSRAVVHVPGVDRLPVVGPG